jgi:cyclic pyranopterin phosphate synthase
VSASEFTHLDPLGRARMVDVSSKEATHRRAVARCRVYMEPETTSKIAAGAISKGDVFAVARVAGIQAAKQTPNLLPLCHPLLVGSVLVNFRIEDDYIEVESYVETVDRIGVEMEAMTACAVACLTIYDMCKSSDRGMVIGEIALWEKTGGRSGCTRPLPLDDDGWASEGIARLRPLECPKRGVDRKNRFPLGFPPWHQATIAGRSTLCRPALLASRARGKRRETWPSRSS